MPKGVPGYNRQKQEAARRLDVILERPVTEEDLAAMTVLIGEHGYDSLVSRRVRVINLAEIGAGVQQIAAATGVHGSIVRRIIEQWNKVGMEYVRSGVTAYKLRIRGMQKPPPEKWRWLVPLIEGVRAMPPETVIGEQEWTCKAVYAYLRLSGIEELPPEHAFIMAFGRHGWWGRGDGKKSGGVMGRAESGGELNEPPGSGDRVGGRGIHAE